MASSQFLPAPRVRCPGCGVKRVSVPWAREGSGFTLLFEALAMTMMASMPVAAVGRLVGEHDTRLWRVFHHHVEEARAYQIRLTFQDLHAQPSREAAKASLKKWYSWATHSRLEPVIEAARTIKRHWHGILRWFDSKIANGILEGINSLVQAAKAKARRYRSIRNLKAIIYLIAGKLELKLPM
jgi:hypothetical protein